MRISRQQWSIIMLLGSVAVVLLGYGAMHWGGASRKVNGNEVRLVHVANTALRAEVVDTKEKMQKGLGDRDVLCGDCAMLFLFSGKERRSFWMKGMRFPLDILWISNSTIVHIEKNISPGATEIFSPQETADTVLEVNAGMSDAHGWKIGDKVW